MSKTAQLEGFDYLSAVILAIVSPTVSVSSKSTTTSPGNPLSVPKARNPVLSLIIPRNKPIFRGTPRAKPQHTGVRVRRDIACPGERAKRVDMTATAMETLGDSRRQLSQNVTVLSPTSCQQPGF
eukprot:1355057-Amorphochlora_amoeboformis.AAC.1